VLALLRLFAGFFSFTFVSHPLERGIVFNQLEKPNGQLYLWEIFVKAT
jgi:hypothetical protein